MDFDELLAGALKAGITVTEFWDLTPREVFMTVEADVERVLSVAWYMAHLQRQQKLPPLARLLANLKPREAVPIQKRREEFEELKARMMLHRSDHGG